MLEGLLIEEFSEDKIDSLVAFIHKVVKDCYPACYSPKVIQFYLEYHSKEELLRKNDIGKVLVAFKENEIVASGYLIEDELGCVYVHSDYQRQGIGDYMVTELLACAEQKGLANVWLDSTPLAVNLYKKHGFAVEEERVMYVKKDPLPYYRMIKSL